MQHQMPHSRVIDAEVVEEVRASGAQASKPAAQTTVAEDDTFNLRSALIMGGMVAVLIGGVYSAHKAGAEARVAQTVAIEQDYRLALNNAAPEALLQTAAYAAPQRGYYQPAARTVAAAPMPDMSASLDRLNEIVERRKALNEVEFSMLRQQLGEEGHRLTEGQTRELLLAAGYRPPARLPAEQARDTRTQNRDTNTEMARYVANELIKDEIQGFLKKIQILAAVGGHIVEGE